MAGWIKLYRNIQEHWIWQDSQKLKWWLDIILLANHQDKKFLLGNELFKVKRGEFHSSELKLADRWKVDRKTVRAFLNLLEKDGMIEVEKTKKGTTVKINKYKDFQGVSDRALDNTLDNNEDNKVPTDSTDESHITGQISPTSLDTNKNDKELIKNDKECKEGEAISKVITYFADKLMLKKSDQDSLISYLEDGMDPELICRSLDIAERKRALSYRYIQGILNKWLEQSIFTVEQLEIRREGVSKGGDSKPSTDGQNSESAKDQFQEYMERNGIQTAFDDSLPY